MPGRGKQLHSVEVDQSGKVEDTRVDTVLAFSDGVSGSILIPAQVKREAFVRLRRDYSNRERLLSMLFATGLFLLLSEHWDHFASVALDNEYTGRESFIKLHLLNLVRRSGIRTQRGIWFTYIGKRSRAHKLAIAVFRGKKKPDRVIGLEELLAEFK